MVFLPSKEESARLREIAHVLYKNHLGYLLTNLRLRKKLPFDKRIKTDSKKRPEFTPELLLKIFEDIDGTFIKLGQLLSLRPDLIPAEYCESLSKLQDTVKPFPGDEAVRIVEKELGKPIRKLFREFDRKPTASASMGQVHLAKLKDGTKVAVKVQRPGVERTVKIDIKLLYRIARAVKKRFGSDFIDPVEIVREFERYTENELNYLKEAHNIDLFYANFRESKTIIIPKVFWSHTKSKVLTMEYIPGKRLTDLKKFRPEQRRKITRTILEAEYEQVFLHGVFHADPHPGNFIIKRDGKIALLDFGIVGRMDYVLREHVTDFFVSLVEGDSEGMVEEAVHLGAARIGTDLDKVRADVSERLAKYHGVGLDKIVVSEVLRDVIRIFRENDIKVLPNLVLLSKATVTLESVASKLDPKFNFVENARPFVKRIARKRMDPKNIVNRARRKANTMVSFIESIPRKTDLLLTDLHETNRDLYRLDRDINMLAVEIDRSSNRITLGFLAGTLFIASTILLPFQTVKVFGVPALSFIGYMIALVVLLSIFVSILKEKRHKSEDHDLR